MHFWDFLFGFHFFGFSLSFFSANVVSFDRVCTRCVFCDCQNEPYCLCCLTCSPKRFFQRKDLVCCPKLPTWSFLLLGFSFPDFLVSYFFYRRRRYCCCCHCRIRFPPFPKPLLGGHHLQSFDGRRSSYGSLTFNEFNSTLPGPPKMSIGTLYTRPV